MVKSDISGAVAINLYILVCFCIALRYSLVNTNHIDQCPLDGLLIARRKTKNRRNRNLVNS